MRAILIALALVACNPPAPKHKMAPGTFDPPIPPAPAAPSRQEQAVQAMGFKDVRLEGSAAFQCDDKDSFLNSTGFVAKNINNVEVHGVVCCGWIKSCTVMF